MKHYVKYPNKGSIVIHNNPLPTHMQSFNQIYIIDMEQRLTQFTLPLRKISLNLT